MVDLKLNRRTHPYVTLSGVQFIMFGASTPKTAEAALVKPSSSYLSSDLQVIGDIKTSSILNIDAAVKGNVVAEKLNVSAQARIEGDVTASDLSVSGEIEGTITGGIVALESTANIVGVIRYDSLSVQAGASVEGQLASRRKVDPAT